MGKRAFAADDVSETLASVLRTEPDWHALPPTLPVSMRRLLRRTLAKDRRGRLADVADARLELEDAIRQPADSGEEAVRVSNAAGWQRRLPWAVAALLGSALVVAIFVWRPWRAPSALPLQRLAINLPATGAYAGPLYGPPAMSPDGTRIAYVGNVGSSRMLFVRALEDVEPRAITGTVGAAVPFFSPDGNTIAFFTGGAAGSSGGGTLRKVPAAGGITVSVCTAGVPVGGTWMTDDKIIFATTAGSAAPGSGTGLFIVSASGGTPRKLANDLPGARWPQLLPDGKHLLLSIQPAGSISLDDSYVAIVALDGGPPRKMIAPGFHARYLPAGYIVYAAGTTLMATRFDADVMETRGEPVPLAENLDLAPLNIGTASYAASDTGLLLYTIGTAARTPQRTLGWTDRRGRDTPLPVPRRAYTYPRISPDGTRIALDIRDQENDIWVLDLSRGTLSRVTSHPANDQYPVWMPDGRQLLFGSNRQGPFNVYLQAADGTGAAERLLESREVEVPQTIGPDGKQVVIRHTDPTTLDDLIVLSVNGPGHTATPTPLVKSPSMEYNADISPDGRWLAYQSNESGEMEVYVRPFPNAGSGRWLVSAGGGTRPVWAKSGRELFYVVGGSPDPVRMMRVPVQSTSTFSASAPELLFEGRYYMDSRTAARGRTYDVSPDGTRFLMIKDDPQQTEVTAATSMTVVLNALNRLR